MTLSSYCYVQNKLIYTKNLLFKIILRNQYVFLVKISIKPDFLNKICPKIKKRGVFRENWPILHLRVITQFQLDSFFDCMWLLEWKTSSSVNTELSFKVRTFLLLSKQAKVKMQQFPTIMCVILWANFLESFRQEQHVGAEKSENKVHFWAFSCFWKM